MEFRLIYKGSLPSQSTRDKRTREKHEIRKQLHPQLRELWKQHPHLRWQSEQKFRVETTPQGRRKIWPVTGDDEGKTWLQHLADDHQRCGGRFVPLIRKEGKFTCSLAILFLRRDNPGNLIRTGGDIDNRIKVLFDGLKMPSNIEDLGGLPLESDEDPFFCLLEDDSKITEVSITTDRLLIPMDSGEREHDVQLIVHVTMLNIMATFGEHGLV